jgi:hypothetical protein
MRDGKCTFEDFSVALGLRANFAYMVLETSHIKFGN